MARRRMIEASIAYDVQLNTLSESDQLLFIRMLPQTDDLGRLDGHPSVVKARCWPMSDHTPAELAAGIARLIDAGLIAAYETESGSVVIQFKRQAFDRINAVLVKNNKKGSEYGEPAREILSGEEFLTCSSRAPHVRATCIARGIKSKEQRVESKEQRVESQSAEDSPRADHVPTTCRPAATETWDGIEDLQIALSLALDGPTPAIWAKTFRELMQPAGSPIGAKDGKGRITNGYTRDQLLDYIERHGALQWKSPDSFIALIRGETSRGSIDSSEPDWILTYDQAQTLASQQGIQRWQEQYQRIYRQDDGKPRWIPPKYANRTLPAGYTQTRPVI